MLLSNLKNSNEQFFQEWFCKKMHRKLKYDWLSNGQPDGMINMASDKGLSPIQRQAINCLI